MYYSFFLAFFFFFWYLIYQNLPRDSNFTIEKGLEIPIVFFLIFWKPTAAKSPFQCAASQLIITKMGIPKIIAHVLWVYLQFRSKFNIMTWM